MDALVADALSHRFKVSERFASRIKAGDAVFMVAAPSAGLPCTINNGELRQFSGMNSLMLLQVMKDQQWQDPRFFTAAQITESGWSLKPEAKKISLQFLSSTKKGLPLEQPTAQLFAVFNASDIDGIPARIREAVAEVSDVQTAVARAGYSIDGAGIRSELEYMLASSLVSGVKLTPAEWSLRSSIAITFIEAQTSSLGKSIDLPAEQWIQLLEETPLAVYAAVREAELVAAQVMREVSAVVTEREITDHLATNAKLMTPIKQGPDMLHKAGASARTEAAFAERAAVLAVPFVDKDRAKALGAVYYAPQKLWFVPASVDPKLFEEWNPRLHTLGAIATERILIESFTEAMQSLGLDTSRPVEADGKWHNVPVDSKEKRKNLSGSYIFSLDGARDGGAIGTINNKHTGEQMTWRYEGNLLTPEQRARMRQEALAREAVALRETLLAQDAAAVAATEIWEASELAENNSYAKHKAISGTGFRQAPGSLLLKYSAFKGESGTSAIRASENYLIIPMLDATGKLRAVQAVSGDGAVKCFMRGAQKKGTMFVLGAESFDQLVQIGTTAVAYVEGAATGVSFHENSGVPVVICFDAGNLEEVVKQTTGRLPPSIQRIMAVDNDQFFIERATGMLSDKLGLNPHAPNGQMLSVRAGVSSDRSMSLGEVVADGEWHQTARGSYRIVLKHEPDSALVNSAVVEIVPHDGRKMMATYQNRGLEAGRAGMAAVAKVGGVAVQAVMAIPEFKSLTGRPTDWNDLCKLEGPEAIKLLLPEAIGHRRLSLIPQPRVGEDRRLASLSR